MRVEPTFEPDRVVAALNAARVEYVIIGGLAAGAHGVVRATRDLDIVAAPDQRNMDLETGAARHHQPLLAQTGGLRFGQLVQPERHAPHRPADPRQGGRLRRPGLPDMKNHRVASVEQTPQPGSRAWRCRTRRSRATGVHPRASGFAPVGTTSTGMREWATTAFETLPSSTRRTPERPWAPTATSRTS